MKSRVTCDIEPLCKKFRNLTTDRKPNFYICKCGKRFINKLHFRKHILRLKKKVFKCNFKSTCKYNLKRHKMIHAPQVPVKPPIGTNKHNTAKITHAKLHRCNFCDKDGKICEKRFISYYKLLTHMLKHNTRGAC